MSIIYDIFDYFEYYFPNDPWVAYVAMFLFLAFIFSLKQAVTFSDLLDIIFKWIFFPVTIIKMFKEIKEEMEDEEEQPSPPKKSLNQIQKVCIIFMVIGFATWLIHYGWMPERTAIGFVIFFGSLASFFVFKDK